MGILTYRGLERYSIARIVTKRENKLSVFYVQKWVKAISVHFVGWCDSVDSTFRSQGDETSCFSSARVKTLRSPLHGVWENGSLTVRLSSTQAVYSFRVHCLSSKEVTKFQHGKHWLLISIRALSNTCRHWHRLSRDSSANDIRSCEQLW